MAKVVWRPNAIRSLTRTAAYIRQFDPDAADRYTADLIEVGESLANFPHRGRQAHGDLREMVTVPPYVMRYRVRVDDDLETVFILNIRHGRQRLVD